MHRMTWETDAPRRVSLEEYESLVEPDEWISEVSKGWLVREPRPNAYHGIVAANVYKQLNDFVAGHNLGRVIMEIGYRLSDTPLTIRGPDVSYIRHEKVPKPLPRRGYWLTAPDLAIEVLSPSNSASEMQVKVLEYFEAGAAQVWVIDPFNELATVYRSLDAIELVRSPNTIVAGDLLPGFELRLAALFE